MGKTFKKGDLKEYIKKEDLILDEEELNELVDINGSLVSNHDNFEATDTDVKSKFTSREKARRSSQGPASYYPWGGAYYGGYYSMNEEDDILEDEIENSLEEEIDGLAESRMQSLVDEMLTKRKDFDFVKRKTNEADVMHDVSIPDFSELKSKYEKPIVARKLMHLTDLINKQNINGDEMAIILNYFLDKIDLTKLSDERRELLGNKLLYGKQGEQ